MLLSQVASARWHLLSPSNNKKCSCRAIGDMEWKIELILFMEKFPIGQSSSSAASEATTRKFIKNFIDLTQLSSSSSSIPNANTQTYLIKTGAKENSGKNENFSYDSSQLLSYTSSPTSKKTNIFHHQKRAEPTKNEKNSQPSRPLHI